MRRLILLAAIFCILSGARGAASEQPAKFPAAEWERHDPAENGWSSAKLAEAEAWSRGLGTTAVIVVHRGVIVAEWGDVVAKTPLASVRKSLLSALYGNAVARGEIRLTQAIGELGIDDNEPSLSADEKTATVRDLLQARSGIFHPALYETPAMAARRPARFSQKPGTFWYYNNWDFNTLGAIYEHAARSSVFDAFDREIARPIGMQDYRPSDGRYITGAASVYPAYPIDMSARDLARFGLLYLQKGRWSDRQVIPERWVAESVQAYSEPEPGLGYGYMWWTGFSDRAKTAVELPPGSFSARGHGGQLAFVIPAYELVVVHRAPFTGRGQSVLELGRLLRLIFEAGQLVR